MKNATQTRITPNAEQLARDLREQMDAVRSKFLPLFKALQNAGDPDAAKAARASADALSMAVTRMLDAESMIDKW